MRAGARHLRLPCSWLAACAFLAVGLGASGVEAAHVTDVADAIDGDDPFDAHLELRLDYEFHRALITRENTQVPQAGGEARTVRVRELEYFRHRGRLRPKIEIGVFHDLAVFGEWPIIIWSQQNMAFTGGTDVTNSTIKRDMDNPPTVEDWTEPGQEYGIPGYGRNQGHSDWGFDLNQNAAFQKIRSGLDYPILGVKWSPVNNERDNTKPTITLQFDYKPAFLLPVALSSMEPKPTGTALSTENISLFAADGTHRAHFQFAISKEFVGLLDPYFVADYTFPFALTDGVLGLEPRHDGGFRLGMEVVPYTNEELDQRFAVDVSFTARYFSPGRDYSEVSDVFGELTLTDEFFRAGVATKLYFRAWKFIYFDVTAEALYDSPHYLTTEQIGCDGGCPDAGLISRVVNAVAPAQARDGRVSLNRAAGERNPYYNPVYDTVGRRFRAEESIYGRLMLHAALTF